MSRLARVLWAFFDDDAGHQATPSVSVSILGEVSLVVVNGSIVLTVAADAVGLAVVDASAVAFVTSTGVELDVALGTVSVDLS